ncbi:RING-H2 finger protein [Fragilaria crotonensis]|nr:RING-H2 finger protein [Fragilaria crotonensis]
MVGADVVTYIIAGGTIIGGVNGTGSQERCQCRYPSAHGGEVIPANKRYQPKELAEDEEEGAPEEVALCAICIEPFQLGDEVMEGIQCHHEYHHPCMMEWLKKHDDCPVCRKSMWTREAFIEAKKQVFKENPGTLEMELAAFAAGELAVTEAAGTTAEDGDESGNLERVA